MLLRHLLLLGHLASCYAPSLLFTLHAGSRKSAVSGNDAVATMIAVGSLGKVTTRLMHAPAQTWVAEFMLKLVLCSLSAALLLCKPQTKPPRSAKKRACGESAVAAGRV